MVPSPSLVFMCCSVLSHMCRPHGPNRMSGWMNTGSGHSSTGIEGIGNMMMRQQVMQMTSRKRKISRHCSCSSNLPGQFELNTPDPLYNHTTAVTPTLPVCSFLPQRLYPHQVPPPLPLHTCYIQPCHLLLRLELPPHQRLVPAVKYNAQ